MSTNKKFSGLPSLKQPNIFLRYENSSHFQQKHYQKPIRPGKDRTVTSARREQAHSARIWKISREEHTPLILHLLTDRKRNLREYFYGFFIKCYKPKRLAFFLSIWIRSQNAWITCNRFPSKRVGDLSRHRRPCEDLLLKYSCIQVRIIAKRWKQSTAKKFFGINSKLLKTRGGNP